MTFRTARFSLTAGLALALSLVGCAASPSSMDEAGVRAEGVTIADGWVKAADAGMTAMFGEIVNDTDADITISQVASGVSDRIELHETVETDAGERVMVEVEDGFVVPAHSSRLLEPGADHIMLMGLSAPLVAGDEVEFLLALSDGTRVEVTVPVKDFTGANESYLETDTDHDAGGMDMGDGQSAH